MAQLLILLVFVTLLILGYLAARLVYNVFFHPLAEYPGPILGKATRWTWAYYTFTGDLTTWVTHLHEKYGDVVRIAPDELSYISSQAWSDIYGQKSTTGQGNLPKEIRLKYADNGVPSIITAGDDDHRRMRRLQSHMFSEKALGAQEPLITSYIDILIQRLRKQAASSDTDVVDLVKWFNYTTFDILGDLAFGESFQCLESDALHPWISNIFIGIKAGQFQTVANYFSWPLNKLVLLLSPRGVFSARREMLLFAYQQARKRISLGVTDRKDFMSYILKHNDEKGMTQAEIESNTNVLVIAGSETTATFLSGLTYNLLRNPHILKLLTTLIRSSFPSETSITNLALQKLPYLSAVLEEGLRTYPPVPSSLPRRTPVAVKSIVCGKVVPENTILSVHQWPAYSSVRNFADPGSFVPERWIKEGRSEKYEGDDRRVMQAFSVGPRNCLGKNLAYGEMRLILARLLWNFDLELQAESKNWADQKVWLLWEKKPLLVKLIAREH